MKKRKVQVFLCLLMSMGMFAGCGVDTENGQESVLEQIETQEQALSETEVLEENGETETLSWTEEIEEALELEEVPSELTLVMAGDMLMHDRVEASALQEDGSYSYDVIFSHVLSDIQEADIAVVNQEVILGGAELGISGYPAFNAPYELGHDLVEAGFDVICHATNHALDKGKRGLQNCMTFWEEQYPEVTVLGIHASQEEQDTVYIYEQDDMKIAMLNFTYGTNGIALPSDMPYAVDLLDEERVVSALQKAEEQADFTIVYPHWGNEYELGISSQQKKWTQIFLENGVDLVIGTHPHVIEPIEMLTDEETGHTMLVYYSIGNFVNWTSDSGTGIANRMVGGMAQVTIGRNEAGETAILEYGIEPVISHLNLGTDGVSVYFLKDYTTELGNENEIRKQDAAFSYDYCVELCDKVWGELWRE